MVPPTVAAALRRAVVAADGAPGACNNRLEAPPAPAQPRRARPIDIMFFVERLEALIANGKKLPLTNNVVVDQAGALELIDELAHRRPRGGPGGQRINSEGERILERAQEEAERIVARAQEQAAFLIERAGPDRAAEDESRRIVDEADADAAEIRRGADEYAAAVLIRLECEVVRTLESIKKGIELLDERAAAMRAPASRTRTTPTRGECDGGRARGAARQPAPAGMTRPSPADALLSTSPASSASRPARPATSSSTA